jgi:hypothetical protein
LKIASLYYFYYSLFTQFRNENRLNHQRHSEAVLQLDLVQDELKKTQASAARNSIIFNRRKERLEERLELFVFFFLLGLNFTFLRAKEEMRLLRDKILTAQVCLLFSYNYTIIELSRVLRL